MRSIVLNWRCSACGHHLRSSHSQFGKRCANKTCRALGCYEMLIDTRPRTRNGTLLRVALRRNNQPGEQS